MTDTQAKIAPNQHLIGIAGSRNSLMTPALILDLDVFEQNLAKMAEFSRAAGVALRSHGKSHKSVRIAHRQREAGAVGACCATVGEAEVFAKGSVEGILITTPISGGEKLERLGRLLARVPDIMLAVDSTDYVNALQEIARANDLPIAVLVDIDPGIKRTGVPDEAALIGLARAIEDSGNLKFAGVQFYAGDLQHVEEESDRLAQLAQAHTRLSASLSALREAGLAPAIVSGGGTGSFDRDAASGLFTELQVGSYIFLDAQYARVRRDKEPRFLPSLFVKMAVTSANHSGLVTVDAGLKHFAFDGGVPVLMRGAPAGAIYSYAGDEHGWITTPAAGDLKFGHMIEGMVPHCDPTVNLYNEYHCVRGDTLVDIWPVDARGA